jgi:hypothetical protein
MQRKDLLAKYERILALRDTQATRDPAEHRKEMARLAGEFPGALREADELPMEELRARIALLGDVGAETTAELAAVMRYHELTRGALCAKAWLAGRKEVTDALRRAFLAEAAALCWGGDALEWSDALADIARPPRGRVTDLVFGRIAGERGISEATARALVFPNKGARRTE